MVEEARDLDTSLGLCTYCPSLCRHACPVATAEGSDTISPWGMMSLAAHVRAGRVNPTPDVVATLGACNGCGACTNACLHENDVMGSLISARADIIKREPALAPKRATEKDGDLAALFDSLAPRNRQERPAVSLVPGRGVASDAVRTLLALCDRLDVESIACGELARLDLGYDAWFAGDHATFIELARRAHAATTGARDIVVMSAEALYLLKVVYPRFGLSFGAEILHVSEMLLPLLSGAVVRRLVGRVGYQESCHLSRHLDVRDLPRQVLRRVLEGPLRELPKRADITGCCGGSGRHIAHAAPGPAGQRAFGTTARMADDILEAAAESGFDRLVSFSPECVEALRGAHTRLAERGLSPLPRVDHAVSLVAEAVVGEGAAA